MKLLLTLIVLFFSLSFVKSQQTLTLKATIYDQHPIFNPNFESCALGLSTGMVNTDLDPVKKVPVLKSTSILYLANTLGCLNRPDLFSYFFTDNSKAPKSINSGFNIPIQYDLVFTKDTVNNVYTYTNSRFFPINNQGIDDPTFNSNGLPITKYRNSAGQISNFHFCMKINDRFTYKGNEIFNFQGDDDVWVFINNKLVIDLGGVHTGLTKNIDLRTLGLTVGNTYNFDFFYCERHTLDSTIKISTNIEVICPWYDFCGVCQGNGSTCCNPRTTCNDNNVCTNDACPPPQTQIPNGKNISSLCTHTPISNPFEGNQCVTAVCDSVKGYISTPITCQNRSNECLSNVGCDPLTGCQYESFCNNVCDTKQCSNGTCAIKSSDDCASELDGNTPDLCKVYSCDPSGAGCIKNDKCTPSPNKCVTTSCNATNGACIDTPIQNPFEGNKCLVSSCDQNTGVYSSTPFVCPDRTNECLVNIGCDPSTGCQYESSCTDVCNIKGQCNNGTCSIKTPSDCALELDGNNPDLCSIYSCNSNGTGCMKQVKCTPSSNKCVTTSCNATNGACIDTPIQNPFEGNICVASAVCDPDTGIFTPTPITCANRTNECLVNTGCDPSSSCGCQYKSSCKSQCYKCVGGDCIKKTSNECAFELEGGADPCKTYDCDDDIGCFSKPKCQLDNHCQLATCSVNSTTLEASCSYALRADIFDNDPCTNDDCDPCTGIITHTPSKMCNKCKDDSC